MSSRLEKRPYAQFLKMNVIPLVNEPYVNGVTLTGEIVFNMILVSWLEIDISYETTLIVYGSLRIF